MTAPTPCLLRTMVAASVLALFVLPLPALAFPPYRSTDAETAPRGVLEGRLGLLHVERESDGSSYTAPLVRLNLGLVDDVELVSEFEYSHDEHGIGEGAVGVKLVSPRQRFAVGVETLALLPVSSGESGVGIEAQLVATRRPEPFRVHLNVGGCYDPRRNETERGWRASVLTEMERARARPGVELFARQFRHRPVEVQLGGGVIFPVARVSVRAGVHIGLTREAPDVTATLWISAERRLWWAR